MLIPQNDEGTETLANSYIDRAEFAVYCTLRNIDISSYTDNQIDGSVIQTTDYIDQKYAYSGTKLVETQTTAIPTSDTNGVNPNFKKASCIGALHLLQGGTFDVVFDGATKNIIEQKNKAAVLEQQTKYSSPFSGSSYVTIPAMNSLLRPYTTSTNEPRLR